MQGDSVNIVEAKKVMEQEIKDSIRKFQDVTGFLPTITQVVTSGYAGNKTFTSSIKVTIEL